VDLANRHESKSEVTCVISVMDESGPAYVPPALYNSFNDRFNDSHDFLRKQA